MSDGAISFNITVDAVLESCPATLSLNLTCSQGDEQLPCQEDTLTLTQVSDKPSQSVFIVELTKDEGDYTIEFKALDDVSGYASEI